MFSSELVYLDKNERRVLVYRGEMGSAVVGSLVGDSTTINLFNEGVARRMIEAFNWCLLFEELNQDWFSIISYKAEGDPIGMQLGDFYQDGVVNLLLFHELEAQLELPIYLTHMRRSKKEEDKKFTCVGLIKEGRWVGVLSEKGKFLSPSSNPKPLVSNLEVVSTFCAACNLRMKSKGKPIKWITRSGLI